MGAVLSDFWITKPMAVDPPVERVSEVESICLLASKELSRCRRFQLWCQTNLQSCPLRQELKERFSWLNRNQVEEITRLFLNLRSLDRIQGVFQLKKKPHLTSSLATCFTYLIRQNDFLVNTKRCIGRGHSKSVDEIIQVFLDGKIEKLCHVKLIKQKRTPKYFSLVAAEYHCRHSLNSPYLLSSGQLYACPSKKGEFKLSWITPFYNRSAANVIPLEKVIGWRYLQQVLRLPKVVLSLALGMARGLQFMHSRGWIHRDIKLENYLVLYNTEQFAIEEVVVADTAFSIKNEEAEIVKNGAIEELKALFFQGKESFGVCIDQNPTMKMMIEANGLPSVNAYQRSLLSSPRDPDSVKLLEFLKAVDRCLIVGTPDHIPLELYTTRLYTQAADCYALGYSLIRLKERLERHTLLPLKVDQGFEELSHALIHIDPKARPTAAHAVAHLTELLSRLS